MEGPIDLERKGYDSIGCYTYFVTLSYDLDLVIIYVFKYSQEQTTSDVT